MHELLRSPTNHSSFPPDIAAFTANPSPEALNKLKDYLRSILFLNFPANVFIQLLATNGFLLFVFVIGCESFHSDPIRSCHLTRKPASVIVVTHRIYKRRFWVMRFTHRAEGTYIVVSLPSLAFFMLFKAHALVS